MKKQLLFSLSSNLIMEYTGNGVDTFDPTFVTSISTTIIWQPDNAPATVTGPGTTHVFSYVPSSGAHRCVIKVIGGLGLVVSIDSNTDALTSIRNLEKCTKLATFIAYNNPALVLDLSSVSAVTYYMDLHNCVLVQGNLSSLSSLTYYLSLYNCVLVQGNLSSLSSLTYSLSLYNCVLVQGNLSSLSSLTYRLDMYGCLLVQGNLVPKVAYCYLGNQAANQARVDSILDYIYQAVLIDPNYYPATTPLLSIIANDATPSGVYQVASPPTTGLEKVYFLCHLASHHWSITWNGGSGP